MLGNSLCGEQKQAEPDPLWLIWGGFTYLQKQIRVCKCSYQFIYVKSFAYLENLFEAAIYSETETH